MVSLTQTDKELVVTSDDKHVLLYAITGVVAVGLALIVTVLLRKGDGPIHLNGGIVVVLLTIFAAGYWSAYVSKKRTTTIRSEGSGQIQVTKLLGQNSSPFVFNTTDIGHIDYVLGYDEKTDSSDRSDTIYMSLVNGQHIVIAESYGRSLGIRTLRPLDMEAKRLAEYLGSPLNVIDIRSMGKGIKRFRDVLPLANHDPAQTSFKEL